MNRGVPLFSLIFLSHISTVIQQQFDSCLMSILGSEMKGCVNTNSKRAYRGISYSKRRRKYKMFNLTDCTNLRDCISLVEMLHAIGQICICYSKYRVQHPIHFHFYRELQETAGKCIRIGNCILHLYKKFSTNAIGNNTIQTCKSGLVINIKFSSG